MTEQEYIKNGFNAGYQLQQHSPELAETIQQGFTNKDHPYAKGFVAGSQEFALEKSNTKSSYLDKQIQEAQKYDDNKSNTQNFDKDKGIDL